ncbi:MAG: DUF6788 family protein [Candidatus Omnitrophota bacterium]
MESMQNFFLKSRHASTKIAPPIEEVICGNIVMVERTCGKASCRCRKGLKHRSMYISQSTNSKTKMTYIPRKHEEEVMRFVHNYKRLKVVLRRVSEYNLMMLSGK